MTNLDILATTTLALASLTIARIADIDATSYVELIGEPGARITDECAATEIYLFNRLGTEAVVATLAIDRPALQIGIDVPVEPAIAEVMVDVGDAVFIAETCPNLECEHSPAIYGIELIEARLHEGTTIRQTD